MSGTPIQIGYPWRQVIEFTLPDGAAELFPASGAWTAHVKYARSEAAPRAVASVTRLGDFSIQISLGADATKSLKAGSVIADIVRTDVTPAEHTFLQLEIEVVQPVTRPGMIA